MNGQIIDNGENFIKIVINCDACLKLCIGRKERVVSHNLHTEINSSIGNKSADSAETDNAECFALDFGTCKRGFAFFNGFAHIVALVFDCFAPINRLCHLS